MPNFKYLEVRNKNEIFVCLLPINSLRISDHIHDRNIDYEIDENRIVEFIISLEQDNGTTAFATDIITERVAGSDPLIEILPKIRKQRFGVLGVVDNAGKLIGILNKNMVEAKIADEVLRARKRS